MRYASILILTSLLFALSPGTALTGEEETPSVGADMPSMDEAAHIAQRYLRLTMSGRHAGGMGIRVGTLPDGRMLYEMRMRMEMTRSTTGEDEKFVIEQESLEVYDAEGNTLSSLEVTKEAGIVTKVFAKFQDGHVDIHHDGPGGTYEKRLKLPDDFSTDYKVFQELQKAFKAEGKAHRKYQSLDASGQEFKPNEMWLLGKATCEHGGRTYPAWKLKQKTEDLLADALVGDDYLPYEMSLMGGFLKATWVDEPPFEVEGGGWAVSVLVAVDRVVPRSLDLEELEVRFVLDPPPAADAPPLFEANPYQEVERETGGYKMVLRAQRPPKDFVSAPLPVKTDDPEVAAFLEATPQAQSDHTEIVQMAQRLAKDASDALDASTRIVRWVWANVAKRSGARGSATALEVLQNLEGDCTEHATLTVALCRAVGIPARAIGGLVYVVTGDGRAIAGYHAWAEVWVGRWVAVDATIPEVGTSARYAQLHIDEPGQPDRVGGLMTALASKTRLEVLAWKHFGGERVEAKPTATAK